MFRSPAFAVAMAVLLWPAAGHAKGIRLDSREYKLMLDVSHFAGHDPGGAIERLAGEMLEPLIDEQTGAAGGAGFSFALDEQRIVRFWDTARCDLDKRGFALRERADVEGQGGEIFFSPTARP